MKNEMTLQEEYIFLHHKHHKQIRFYRIFFFALFLAVWEISSRTGMIDSFFFSSPSLVIKRFWAMCVDQSIFMHIGVTVLETIVSFLFVFFISLILATLLWYSSSVAEVTEPYLVILNSLPKSALAPLFIVWLGTGMTTIIVAGISVAVFGSVISFYTAFMQADRDKIKLIRTLGGSRRDAFSKVILPGSVPILLSTTKVNIGLSLVGVIIGEFLAARQGLGYLIIYGSQVFQLDLVITSIILLCIIAMILYKGIQSLEHFIKKKATI